MRRLWVDFNGTYDSDYIGTSIRNSYPSLEPVDVGDWVTLYDDDDAECMAVVRAVDGPIVDCEIDWSTWTYIATDWDVSGLPSVVVTP